VGCDLVGLGSFARWLGCFLVGCEDLLSLAVMISSEGLDLLSLGFDGSSLVSFAYSAVSDLLSPGIFGGSLTYRQWSLLTSHFLSSVRFLALMRSPWHSWSFLFVDLKPVVVPCEKVENFAALLKRANEEWRRGNFSTQYRL
jgi:hypothetical protein